MNDERTPGDGAPTEPVPPVEPTEPVAATPPPPPPAPAPAAAPAAAGRGPARVLAVLLVLALAAAAVGVWQWRDADRRADRLDARLDRLEDRAGRGGDGGPPGGPEEPGGPLDELFGELFGGDGDPGAGLEELFGELFGGEGGPFGALGAVFECLGDDLLGGAPSGVPDTDARAQVTAVARAVEAERGLEFDEVPEPLFVTPDEIDRRVRREIRSTYPEDEARLDGLLLAALGAVEPGTELADLEAEFVGGQVAGYYDPATGELVVATDDPEEPLDTTGLIVLAHELEHALADQTLDLPIDEDATAGASDEQLAATALVEGDATLTMYRLMPASGSGGLSLEFDPGILEAQEALAEAPAFLASRLQFPYNEGLLFACGLERDGGWDAVDEAYREPPTTTAQILFPERYAAGEGAADVAEPGEPGGPWREARRKTFGAAELLWLFQAPGDDRGAALDDPLARVGAWGGGEVVQWTDGDRHALALALRGREGGDGLCGSVRDWYAAAFPDAAEGGDDGAEHTTFAGRDQDAVLRCTGADVVLGIAPDLPTATAIAH